MLTLLTHSDAIVVDGVYSALVMTLSLLGLLPIKLRRKVDNLTWHFNRHVNIYNTLSADVTSMITSYAQ